MVKTERMSHIFPFNPMVLDAVTKYLLSIYFVTALCRVLGCNRGGDTCLPSRGKTLQTDVQRLIILNSDNSLNMKQWDVTWLTETPETSTWQHSAESPGEPTGGGKLGPGEENVLLGPGLASSYLKQHMSSRSCGLSGLLGREKWPQVRVTLLMLSLSPGVQLHLRPEFYWASWFICFWGSRLEGTRR